MWNPKNFQKSDNKVLQRPIKRLSMDSPNQAKTFIQRALEAFKGAWRKPSQKKYQQ
jgi:hypothetical protein